MRNKKASRNLGEHCNSQESETKNVSSSSLPSVPNMCLRLNELTENSARNNLVWFNRNYNNEMAVYITSQLSHRTEPLSVITVCRRRRFRLGNNWWLSGEIVKNQLLLDRFVQPVKSGWWDRIIDSNAKCPMQSRKYIEMDCWVFGGNVIILC